jgi:hypothetical protein
MQHVVRGVCQLARDRLDRDDTMLARQLALVLTPDQRIEAHRVVGRFHVGSC